MAGRPRTSLRRRGALPGRSSPLTTRLPVSQAPPLFCGGAGPSGAPRRQALTVRPLSALIACRYEAAAAGHQNPAGRRPTWSQLVAISRRLRELAPRIAAIRGTTVV
ncbi:hypothetical protein NDU88_005843 [Pleurodeles waltl]|uniref:Uncharacterized protein n=1 Tax=Pleurodeles waltl TaxID=8319 RepID=A0AAV7SMT4_PLEWA|nr:hypothetical protein NDU88_005843 [Pleurodeles waltl]